MKTVKTYNPQAYLEIAKILYENPFECDDEAQYRTIINRSYYAPLLMAEEYLEPFVGSFSHDSRFYRKIVEALRARTADISAEKLDSLRIWREEADYKLKQKRKTDAKMAIDTSEDVLSTMPEEIK